MGIVIGTHGTTRLRVGDEVGAVRDAVPSALAGVEAAVVAHAAQVRRGGVDEPGALGRREKGLQAIDARHLGERERGERLAKAGGVGRVGARRNALAADEWSAWFGALAVARPKAEPPKAASLATRHNLSQFLLSLYASLKESATPEMQARLLPGVTAALKSLD